MMQPKKLSDRLLELDQPGGSATQQLDERVSRLFDRPLSGWDWVWMLLMAAGGLAGFTVCGLLAVGEPASTPLLTRLVLAVLALIGLCWATLAATIVRRGAINSATHGAMAAKMGFLFSLAAAVLMGVCSLAGLGGNPTAGLVLLPLATLILATVVVIAHAIRQAELRLQQRLLEVEYRLAVLTEGREANANRS